MKHFLVEFVNIFAQNTTARQKSVERLWCILCLKEL